MDKEEKKKKLNDYKLMLDEIRNLKKEKEDNSNLANHFNKSLKMNNSKKLIKKPNGFTNVIIPIIITVFIIGFAVGLAFAIYKF